LATKKDGRENLLLHGNVQAEHRTPHQQPSYSLPKKNVAG
jgi:hypothetical protein